MTTAHSIYFPAWWCHLINDRTKTYETGTVGNYKPVHKFSEKPYSVLQGTYIGMAEVFKIVYKERETNVY